MFGLAKESIVIGREEARGYISAKIEVLEKERSALLDQLDKINDQIDEVEYYIAKEKNKLYAVEAGPMAMPSYNGGGVPLMSNGHYVVEEPKFAAPIGTACAPLVPPCAVVTTSNTVSIEVEDDIEDLF